MGVGGNSRILLMREKTETWNNSTINTCNGHFFLFLGGKPTLSFCKFFKIKMNIYCLLFLGLVTQALAIFDNTANINRFIQPKCYSQESARHVNGQKFPLSQTLENFIHLVEKFEEANQDFTLEETLLTFIFNYAQENLMKNQDRLTLIKPDNLNIELLKDLWKEKGTPRASENPFTDDEICSLFYMLSHTVDNTLVWEEPDPSQFFLPEKKAGQLRSVGIVKYPRETGTVSVRSGMEAVALGPVIMGLYSTFLSERSLKSLLKTDTTYNGTLINNQIKPLFLNTLSDALLIGSYDLFSKTGLSKALGEDGRFEDFFVDENNVAVLPDTEMVCPTIYKLPENATSLYTYALIRGATDGLILGSRIKDINNGNVLLSQILRSYYTPQGIAEPNQIERQNVHFSHCNRLAAVEPLLPEVYTHIELEMAVLTQNYQGDKKFVEEAIATFIAKKEAILQIKDNEYCRSDRNDKNGNVNYETPVEIIMVMDTTKDLDDIKIQRQIIGYAVSQLDLSSDASSVTVYSDNADEESQTLIELIPKSYSSAAVACRIVQEEIPVGGESDRSIVIQSLMRILENRKSNVSLSSGTPGLIVVYFNFHNEETESDQVTRALSDLHKSNMDVKFLVVGRNQELLKKYTALNAHAILQLKSDKQMKPMGDEIAKTVRYGPSTFQYNDCKLAKKEGEAKYEGYVTVGSFQTWAMHTKHFLKSYTAKFYFDAIDGDVLVCRGRDPRPELISNKCNRTTSTSRRAEFQFSNPCSGLTEKSCPSIYFSILGLEPNREDNLKPVHYCSDKSCKSLNQVKFSLSHDGVRCSGCNALFTPSSVLLLLFASVLYLFSVKS